ncbi:hypothetical protein [Sinorhizobium meliloti]|jgi:hypothetical protein|uniref:hypothetical protein n=1 Tax=Rhizobium meliloti TaxID=382 RepID=UPI003F147ACA
MRRQVRGLQDVYGEVPTTSALELRDFGEAAAGFSPDVAGSRRRNQGNGTEVAATYVVSNTNPTGWPFLGNNTHSGLFIIPDDGDPEGRFLYDPSGSYRAPEIGSGHALHGPDVSPEDYLNYQLRDGPSVTIRRYPTTPEEEAEIIKRSDDAGGGGDVDCTYLVSGAIEGIGPFREVQQTMWPVGLDNQLRRLKKHVGEASDPESLRRLLSK